MQLITTLTQNVVTHFPEITRDIQKIPQDWSSNQFKDAGEDIADIMLQSIGPIPQAYPDMWSTSNFQEWFARKAIIFQAYTIKY